MSPEMVQCVCGFLAAYADVEKHGMMGWITANTHDGQVPEVDEDFVLCLKIFGGELARLEADEDVAEAMADFQARERERKGKDG
jgi:hypothetical protein